MRESVTRITTTDTNKTYEFPSKDKSVPQLWEVSLAIKPVCGRSGYVDQSCFCTEKVIHLERATLENAGLLGMEAKRKINNETPTETAEDLIIRLLAHVGVFPAVE